jgi:hypothetical protein
VVQRNDVELLSLQVFEVRGHLEAESRTGFPAPQSGFEAETS